ncbi:MAG: hypothetical protein ACYS4W_11580 [Planctomycetota bacterium]|jgi:hypothetical protein
MKDVYKNPNLYYVLVPVVLAMWPLLVWAVYLPGAERKFGEEKEQSEEARKKITEILTLDPGRLTSTGADGHAAEFEYATEVDKVARSCGIPASAYQLISKPKRRAKGQTTQNCRVVLKEVDIADLTLTKLKGLPDAWKVGLNFKYYY